MTKTTKQSEAWEWLESFEADIQSSGLLITKKLIKREREIVRAWVGSKSIIIEYEEAPLLFRQIEVKVKSVLNIIS